MAINPQRRLLLTGIAALGVAACAPYAVGDSPLRVIKLSSRKFEFSPNTLHLKRGETVELELTAEDVVMGINIPELKTRSDMIPGLVKRLRVTPEKTGKFTFYCDVFCGSGHEDMAGEIVVT